MSELILRPEDHVNPFQEAARTHVPAPGDIYAVRSASYNSHDVMRLVERRENGYWKCVDAFTGEEIDRYGVSEDNLAAYYRWIQNDTDEVFRLASMVTEGKAADVAGLVGSGLGEMPTEGEALMRTESPEHIAALLETSERIQNKLQEIRLVADCMIEKRKKDLENMLGEMNGYLSKMNEKVENLLKVITVLNLYTGRTVDVHQIVDGEPAGADEPLCLRQRILYMDEELCVHLDHEADYKDVPLFFEWLKEPANRDIIVPEERCVVCLKPKRFSMGYRSGDPVYDDQRDRWNRHTYVVIRNGERLYWFESEDLEVWEWAFPHEDFEEEASEMIARGRWDGHALKEHDAVTYRVTKYMMFLQGLLDQRQDLVGPLSVRPNLMKLQGVRLVRDDENLLGTGRKPWEKFRDEKNALIRRGTRILYIPGDYYWRYRETSSGDFLKFYMHDFSKPEFPSAGLYSADEAEKVVRHVNGKPVVEKYPRLVFLYMPGDTVWNQTEGDHERRNRCSWVYNPKAVLNYDAVTLEELQGYLDDRTLRDEFSTMIPMLVKMKLYKMEEAREEEFFKKLLSGDIKRETGRAPAPEAVDEAVAWWKSKVIFTRALRSDDAKAWKMIRARVLRLGM